MPEQDGRGADIVGDVAMKKALVLLANGCEEMEAVTTVDILRRGGVEVTVAGVNEGVIQASRGVRLVPDQALDAALKNGPWDMVVLPGGMDGTRTLTEDPRVQALLRETHGAGGIVAAICAAPMALERAGLLSGCRFTAYPGVLKPDAGGGTYTGSRVEVDGNLVTSRGPGTAVDFALTLVEIAAGRMMREKVRQSLVMD